MFLSFLELGTSVQNVEKTTPSFGPLGLPQIKEEPEEQSQQQSTDASNPTSTGEQSHDVELLQDESETPAGDPQTSPHVSNGNKSSTAAASKKLVITKKTKSKEPNGDTKLPSKGRREKRNLATTKRKEQDATSAALKERQESTKEDSVGSGCNEVIALERCDDESQESFTDLELTQLLNKSDDNNKEISSTTADSRPQKESSDESMASVSARKMETNERHETTPDFECSDGITKSLMTPTLDEKPHGEDSTLPEIDKSGSDGEFDGALNEEHNNEDSSQGELELTLKRKAQGGRAGCVVPSAGNETSRGKMHQLRDEISGTEEPGGTVKAKAKKRFRDTTSSKIPKDCNPYRCDKCGKVMSNFKNYKSHVKSHTVGKTFECSDCGKLFREKWDLNKHVIIHSTEKSFTCEFCGRGFNRRYNLELHLRVHTGEKPFRCDTCDKSFRACVNLKKHLRIHTGEKPYTCKDCGKEFSDSSAYKNHLRVHSGEKPFSCNFCKRRFATGTTLKRHTRTHTGEKPYKCDVCDKLFGRGSDLKSHSRMHTGERP